MSLVSSSDRLRRAASRRLGRASSASDRTPTERNQTPRAPFAPVSAPPATPARPSQRLRAVSGLEPGALIGSYEVREVLGRGSMGRVLRARDPLGRDVAIKVVLPEMCDEEGRARFRREGQAMAAVPPHRNVVTVHSTGEHGPAPYLVMDYVAGESLEQVLKRGALPLERAVHVAEQMARALEHVHRAGVLHRDIKPANVVLRAEDGEPVLTDFGMAALRGAERLTRTGDLLGTPLYMAPEQVLGTRIDRRSEVWAVGAILFEMLAGRPPFEGQTLADVSRAITNDPVPSLARLCPAVDPELERIVAGCLRKHPTDRPARPGAVADALAGWRAGRREPGAAVTGPRARVGIVALLAASSLLLAGDAVWRVWRSHTGSPGLAALLAPAADQPAAAGGDGGPAAAQLGSREAAPAAPAVTAPHPALEGPLRAAGAAVDRDDPLAARELLAPVLEKLALERREGLSAGDRARLQALRLQAVGRAPRWLPDAARLTAGLELLALLGPWVPPTGSAGADLEAALGDQLLVQVRRLEAAAQKPSEHEVAVALLESLVQSGLRPRAESLLDRALDDLWLMTKQAELSPERRQAAQGLFWRGLLALARLDAVPSASALLAADLREAPWRPGRDPLGDALLLAVKTRRRETAANAERALAELAGDPARATPACGPRLRAWALTLGVDGLERSEARLSALGQALELDPHSPWARRELARELLRTPDGAVRAQEQAERALSDYMARHADRASTAWEAANFQLAALEAAAAAGDLERLRALRSEVAAHGQLDPDRARWIEERLQEAERRANGARKE